MSTRPTGPPGGLQLAGDVGGAGQAVERMIETISSILPRRSRRSRALSVTTASLGDRRRARRRPSATSISTSAAGAGRRRRVEHVGGAQAGSLGAGLNAAPQDRRPRRLDDAPVDGQQHGAAREPACRVDVSAERIAVCSYCRRRAGTCRRILGEMGERTAHRIELKRRAQRRPASSRTGRRAARVSARRSPAMIAVSRPRDPARRAHAAPRPRRRRRSAHGHVDRVVEHHDAAVADQPPTAWNAS